MARTISITDDMYRSFIDEEINKGRSLADIKATEDFKSVGGTFLRAATALEAMQDSAKNTAPARELPAWFIEWKNALINQVAQTAESAWFKLGTQIDQELSAAKDGFDTSLEKLKARITTRDEQITNQEIEIEGLKAKLDQLETDATAAATIRIQQDLELAQATREVAHLKGEAVNAQATHEQMVKDLTTANSTLTARDQRITSLEGERNTAEAELKRLTGELAISNTNLQVITEAKGTLKSDLATVNKELRAATLELNKLKPTYEQLQATTKDQKAELNTIKKTLDTAVQDRATAIAQLNLLKPVDKE